MVSVRSAKIFALGLMLASLSMAALAQRPVRVVPGELLVGLRGIPSAIDMTGPETDRSVGAVLQAIPQLGVMHVRVAQGYTMEQAAARLRARHDVAYVEPNGVYTTTANPNDAGYANQYAPAKVQADLAWPLWVPKASVILAIVDTGVDYTHPDLSNKVLRDNGVVVGYNSIGSNARTGVATDPMDDNSHGTHCAGIAAGQINNGVGMAGISGWNGAASSTDTSTLIMPVKVLDKDGSGTDGTVAVGITWAADHGARVISLSLGGGGSTTLSNAVAYARNKGCVVVAAAGNESSSAKSYPGGYAGVISVASTDSTDTLSSFSNYGTWVSCAAPGSNIYSTLPTSLNGTANYGKYSGTSMATPLVAGEAAFLLGHSPTLTGVEIETLIKNNTDPYVPYSGRTIAAGAGRVNVYKALQAATGTPLPPSAPTGLTATAGSGQVSLTWNGGGGAASYNVKRSTTNGGPYTTIASPTGTTYTNTGLTNGTTYYYVVSAVNTAGESANSAQASATPAASTSSQLLVNPGFELGDSGAWVASSEVITNDAGRTPRTGAWYGWLCGYGGSHTDTLYQQVAIPANVKSASLTFYIKIDTAETTSSKAYDKLKVQITNGAGTVLKTLATYSNLNKSTSYALKTFSLLSYKGQTIRILLSGTEDASLQTSFLVDDFALTVK